MSLDSSDARIHELGESIELKAIGIGERVGAGHPDRDEGIVRQARCDYRLGRRRGQGRGSLLRRMPNLRNWRSSACSSAMARLMRVTR